MDFKQGLYERLGVEELVLLDPYGEYLTPRLRVIASNAAATGRSL